MKDNGVICAFPFVQFSTTSYGLYQACCIATPEGEMNFDNTSPMEFFNSDHMKQIRHDMANGVKSDVVQRTCFKCFESEEKFGASKRLDSLVHRHHGGKVSEETIAEIAKNPNIDLTPTDIDHLKMKVFGNLCNLSCATCAASASSKYASEMKKYGLYDGPILQNPYSKVDKEKLYEDLDIICPAIREFEIVGGEPLLMDESLEMIEWMVSKGYSKHIEFRIITNATVYNMEFFNLMKHFDKATFLVSVDGIGKKDEYIRHGTNWEEKVENIKYMTYAGIEIAWSNTIQVLNIGYLHEIYNFVKDLQKELPKAKINDCHLNNILMYPEKFRSTNIPADIAELYIQKYEYLDVDFFNYDVHVGNLYKCRDGEYAEDAILNVMSAYKYLDEKRGTCLLDEWPEFEDYYSAVGPMLVLGRGGSSTSS